MIIVGEAVAGEVKRKASVLICNRDLVCGEQVPEMRTLQLRFDVMRDVVVLC